MLLGAFLDVFKRKFLLLSLYSFISDLSAIGYTFLIMKIIQFIKKEDGTIEEGVLWLSLFAVCLITQPLFRNKSFVDASRESIILRKVMISSMYDKVASLNMESIARTNSGKLVTILSSDLQAIERPMQLLPSTFASPFVNLVVYIIIGNTLSWEYSLITFVTWIITIYFQMKAAQYGKKVLIQQASYNDERQKLVSDMVIGAKTIKSYGWE